MLLTCLPPQYRMHALPHLIFLPGEADARGYVHEA